MTSRQVTCSLSGKMNEKYLGQPRTGQTETQLIDEGIAEELSDLHLRYRLHRKEPQVLTSC